MGQRVRIGVTSNGRRWAPSWWCIALAVRLAGGIPRRISVRNPAPGETFEHEFNFINVHERNVESGKVKYFEKPEDLVGWFRRDCPRGLLWEEADGRRGVGCCW